MATANDLRRGMAINYNGDICVVLDFQHRTPGNLRAFVQASLRSIRTGKSSDIRLSSTEKIEPVPMITTKMEFSYKDGQDYVFTDPTTYETVTLTAELVGDAKNYLVENGEVTVTFVEEKAVTVEIPASVTLTVTDAPEGVRGDSANNVQKAIVLETGITVQAPLFIKTGEKSASIRAPANTWNARNFVSDLNLKFEISPKPAVCGLFYWSQSFSDF